VNRTAAARVNERPPTHKEREVPLVSNHHPIWTAEDAAALAALATEFPRTVAESPVLDYLMTCEGLS
jgi:hypothetical protein